jgi:ABC-type uncharacterized transport system permease subunit
LFLTGMFLTKKIHKYLQIQGGWVWVYFLLCSRLVWRNKLNIKQIL